jgi:hypothetical protein
MFPSVICRNKVQAQVEATQAVQHKPFEVGRDAADILASFGTLEDTVRNVRRHVATGVLSFITLRKIVGLLTGELGGSSEFTIQLSRPLVQTSEPARIGTTSVQVNDFVPGY